MKTSTLQNLAILFVLLLSTFSTKGAEIKIDFHGGINLPYISSDYVIPTLENPLSLELLPIEQHSSVGYGIGVGCMVNIKNGFGIYTGLDFIQKNIKAFYGNMMILNSQQLGDYDTRFSYFTVPALFNYNLMIPKFKNIVYPSISTGPVVGFRVGMHSFASDNKSIILDWRVGMAFTFINRVKLDINYNIPLTNTFTVDTRLQNGVAFKTGNLSISLGIII